MTRSTSSPKGARSRDRQHDARAVHRSGPSRSSREPGAAKEQVARRPRRHPGTRSQRNRERLTDGRREVAEQMEQGRCRHEDHLDTLRKRLRELERRAGMTRPDGAERDGRRHARGSLRAEAVGREEADGREAVRREACGRARSGGRAPGRTSALLRPPPGRRGARASRRSRRAGGRRGAVTAEGARRGHRRDPGRGTLVAEHAPVEFAGAAGRSSRAAATSSPPRSTASRSTSRAALAASTPAPRPAGSPTACCGGGPLR